MNLPSRSVSDDGNVAEFLDSFGDDQLMGLDDLFDQSPANMPVVDRSMQNKQPYGAEEPQLLSRRVRNSSQEDGLSPLPTWSPQVPQFSKRAAPKGQWQTPPVISFGQTTGPEERKIDNASLPSSRNTSVDDQGREIDPADLDNLLDALEIDAAERKVLAQRANSDDLLSNISPFTFPTPPASEYMVGSRALAEEPQLLSRRVRNSSQEDGLSPLPTWSPQVPQMTKRAAPKGQWQTPPVINYGHFNVSLEIDNSKSHQLVAPVDVPFSFPMPLPKEQSNNNDKSTKTSDDLATVKTNAPRASSQKLTEAERRDRRLERNRASARLRRQRKKLVLDALQVQVSILEDMLKKVQNHEWGTSDPAFLSSLVDVEDTLNQSFMNAGAKQEEEGEADKEDKFERKKYSSYDLELGPLVHFRSLLEQQHNSAKNAKAQLNEASTLSILMTLSREKGPPHTVDHETEALKTMCEELISSLQLGEHQVSSLISSCCPTDVGSNKSDRFIAQDLMDAHVLDTSYQMIKAPKWQAESILSRWLAILSPTQRVSFEQWISQNESAVKALDIDSHPPDSTASYPGLGNTCGTETTSDEFPSWVDI